MELDSPWDLPLLEDDLAQPSILEPDALVRWSEAPKAVVLCFFAEVVDSYGGEAAATLVYSQMRPLYLTSVDGVAVAYCFPGTGAPAAAATMETAIAMGCSRFIAVGGAGALIPILDLGDLVLLDDAVRDEGTSHHYLRPARTVDADPDAAAAIADAATRTGLQITRGRSWTTDAIFRETRTRAERRVAEGCSVVEMEAAALYAVARYRGVKIAQLVYAGDTLAETSWNSRNWTSSADLRQALFQLALTAAARVA